MEQSSPWEAKIAPLLRNYPAFKEPEFSTARSQDPITEPYTESTQVYSKLSRPLP
jgi:hypothetical protein